MTAAKAELLPEEKVQAIESADITLMADKLDKLPFAISLSKATTKNIKQNIIFAILIEKK